MVGFPEAPEDRPGDDGSRQTLDKSDYEALAEFRWRLRQFEEFSETAARQATLTAQQHQALLAIKGAPGRDTLGIGELAERLCIRHHSAVGLVDRLAALGLICRLPDATDRRRVQVSLTPAAEIILRDLSSAHREELRRIGPVFAALLARIAPQR